MFKAIISAALVFSPIAFAAEEMPQPGPGDRFERSRSRQGCAREAPQRWSPSRPQVGRSRQVKTESFDVTNVGRDSKESLFYLALRRALSYFRALP